MKTCRACGAPSAASNCGYCGASLAAAPEITVGAPAHGELGCPRCGDEHRLAGVNLEGVPVDVCPDCSGIWLDRAGLDTLLAPERSGTAAKDAEARSTVGVQVQYIRCPRCRQHMNRQNYLKVSGVIIDTCREHGAWLDAGELRALRAFVASGGHAKAERAEHRAVTERAVARVKVAAVGTPGLGFGGDMASVFSHLFL